MYSVKKELRKILWEVNRYMRGEVMKGMVIKKMDKWRLIRRKIEKIKIRKGWRDIDINKRFNELIEKGRRNSLGKGKVEWKKKKIGKSRMDEIEKEKFNKLKRW